MNCKITLHRRLFGVLCLAMALSSSAFARDLSNYGNKVANLYRLEDDLSQLQIEGLKLAIPPFLPILSEEIRNYLNKVAPDWQNLWNEFCLKQIKAVQLLDESKVILTTLRQTIEEAFCKETFIFTDEAKWLKEHQNDLLIVRSCGQEDGDNFSNAGGNESILAVLPRARDVSKAIGKVIASYFGERSLEQRFLGGDNIYADPDFNAFMQVMIVSKVPKRHPVKKENLMVSGVMYTSDPEIDLVSVTSIQACFGQGTQVVGGLEGVDTFHIDNKEGIYSLIGIKEKSYVAVRGAKEEYSIETLPNVAGIKAASTLTKNQLLYLQKIAQAIENQYGKSMDIEWVLDPQKSTFYIVQMRPICLAEKTKASYVNLQALDKFSIEKGSFIVSAGDSVKIIKDESEVIIAADISNALDVYLHLPSSNKVEAVVIKKWAPMTSHQATIFRNFGIPVFVTSHLKKWKEDLKSNVVLLDPQQDMAVFLNRKTNWLAYDSAIKDLIEQKIMVYGRQSLSFPCSASVGIFGERPVKDFDFGNVATTNNLHVLYEDLIKTRNKDNLASIYNYVQALQQKIPNDCKMRRRFEALKGEVGLVLQKVAQNSERDEGQFLYSMQWLKAFLFQKKDKNFGFVDSISRIEDDCCEFQEKDVLKLASYQKYAFNPQIAKSWEMFVKQIGAQRINILVRELEKRALFQQWLHLHFYPAWKTETNKEQLFVLLSHKLQKIRSMLDEIESRKEAFNKWNYLLSRWENPDNFAMLWRDFSNELLPSILDEKLFSLLKEPSCDSLVKKAAINLLLEGSDLFDKTIKSLKGSALYNKRVDKQLANLTLVLDQFLVLMEKTVGVLSESYFDKWRDNVFEDKEYLQKEKMLSFIRKAFNFHSAVKERKELLPSEGFSVNAASVGSCCAFFRSLTGKRKMTEEEVLKSITLEDLFTLMHQNIVKSLAIIAQESDKTTLEELPWPMTKICSEITKITSEVYTPGCPEDMIYYGTSNPYLVSVHYTFPKIYTNLVHPLRHHSVLIGIEYDQNSKNIVLKFDFFGHNYKDRMLKLKYFVILASIIQGVPFQEQPIYNAKNYTFHYSWKLSKDFCEKNLDQFLVALSDYLMKMERSIFFMDLSLDDMFLGAYAALTNGKNNKLLDGLEKMLYPLALDNGDFSILLSTVLYKKNKHKEFEKQMSFLKKNFSPKQLTLKDYCF